MIYPTPNRIHTPYTRTSLYLAMATVPFNESNNILTIKTVQITPFRTLMTALKDILTETNIVFTPDGIRILNMDKTHQILVNLHLQADKFETYNFNCDSDRIVIGVNVMQLFKMINSIENNDTLTIYIEADDYQDGLVRMLSMRFDNGNIGQCKMLRLKLQEVEPDDHTELPDVKYSSVISMRSVDFQKIIRDMSSTSDRLEIQSVGNETIFMANGPWSSVKLRRSETEISSTADPGMRSKIVQGTYFLKHLSFCTKCTALCPQIELYIENDMPLIVVYRVADLGKFRLCITQI